MDLEHLTREELIATVKSLQEKLARIKSTRQHLAVDQSGLWRSTELINKSFEAQRDAIFILDSSKPPLIINCNPRASEMFGYSREELLGNTTEFLHIDDNALQQFQSQVYSSVVEHGIAFIASFSMKRKDGSIFPTEHSLVQLQNERGERIGWVSVIRDISHRKQAEEILRQKTELLQNILDNTLSLVVVRDLEGRYLLVNKQYEKMFGKTSDELLGRTPFEVHPPEVATKLLWDDRHIIEDRRPLTVEDQMFYQDELHTLLSSKVPLFDKNGDCYAICNVATEITDRKTAEDHLRKSEARYRSLIEDVLDSSESGIFILDAEFKVVWVNQAIAHFFNLDRKNLLGQDKRQLIQQSIQHIFEKPAVFAEKVLLTYQDNTYIEQFECHILPSQGRKERWLEHRSMPICAGLYAGGRIEHYYDITDRKGSEEALKKSEEQLLQAQKLEAIGRLAGGIAHDMNNILASVTAISSTLKYEVDEQNPLRKDMETILLACQRGQDLTRNLLGFARKGKYCVERLSLNQLISETIELLERTLPKQVDIVCHLDPELHEIEGDAGQISHALLNLAINGAEAIESKGQLTITTRNTEIAAERLESHPDLPQGAYVSVAISDTGSGMDSATLSRTFEPFFTTKTHRPGSGLGLAMVYGTIKNHGGSVHIDSAPNKGTTVTFLLPSKGPPDHQQSILDQTGDFVVGSGTILLVDDEELVRLSGKRMLERLGFHVLTANNGASALEVVRSVGDVIKLVILDLRMPVMDGIETYQTLKQMTPHIQVLMSSGYPVEGPSATLLQKEALNFLQKPFTLKDLSRMISTIFGRDKF